MIGSVLPAPPPDPASPQLPAPGQARSRWWMVAVWVVLSAALILAMRALPWREALVELRRAHWGWLIAAAACNLAVLPLWAREWTLLCPPARPVRFRLMLEIVAVASAVMNTIPLMAGELSAVALLISRAALTRAGALTVLAMDQLLVGVGKLSVLAAAALLTPVPAWLRAGTLGLVAAVGGLAIAVLAVAYRGRVHARATGTHSRWLTTILGMAAEMDAHLIALHRAGVMWRAVLLAIAKKGAEVLAALAIQRACGIDLPMSSALLVIAALGLSTMVKVAPANLGVYEATVYVVYRFLGVEPQLAIAASVLQHVAYLLPLAVPGWVLLSVRQVRKSTRRRADANAAVTPDPPR